MYIQTPEYAIIKPCNKVILHWFLEQLGLWLLNPGIKCKFEHFLCLTILDILKTKVGIFRSYCLQFGPAEKRPNWTECPTWFTAILWPLPYRHCTTSEPILNQYYLFRTEPILNESWTITEWRLNQSYWFVQPLFGYGFYWFVRPLFGYGSHTYIRIRSHIG